MFDLKSWDLKAECRPMQTSEPGGSSRPRIKRAGLPTRLRGAEKQMRDVSCGTYDLGKPRTRILLRGIRENGVEVTECQVEGWRGYAASRLNGSEVIARTIVRMSIAICA